MLRLRRCSAVHHHSRTWATRAQDTNYSKTADPSHTARKKQSTGIITDTINETGSSAHFLKTCYSFRQFRGLIIAFEQPFKSSPMDNQTTLCVTSMFMQLEELMVLPEYTARQKHVLYNRISMQKNKIMNLSTWEGVPYFKRTLQNARPRLTLNEESLTINSQVKIVLFLHQLLFTEN